MSSNPKRKKLALSHDLPYFPDKGKVFYGVFCGFSVVVSDYDAMVELYYQGNFGKGSLSKSGPLFHLNLDDVPEILTECRWQRRCQWAESWDPTYHADATPLGQFVGKEKFKDKLMKSSLGNLLKSVPDYDPDCWRKWKNTQPECVKDNTNCSSKIASDIFNLDENPEDLSDSSNFSRQWMKIVDSNFWTRTEESESQAEEGKASYLLQLKVKDNVDDINENDSTFTCQNSVIVIPNITEDMELDEIFGCAVVKTEDLKTVHEQLVLSLPESFFLAFALGCLKISDMNRTVLSVEDVWTKFKEIDEQFIERYVAYHYYRSKGWVVKSGLKYGGDFLLYKQGPACYHSSYVVIIEVIDGDTYKRKTEMTWNKCFGLNRMLETAQKELLLCQIFWPRSLSENDLSTPQVLSKFTIQEVLPKRWVPSQERNKEV